MKTYMTAKQFEKELDALQKRCDKVAERLSSHILKKSQALFNQLDDVQKARVLRRHKTKILEGQMPTIISPGSARFS